MKVNVKAYLHWEHQTWMDTPEFRFWPNDMTPAGDARRQFISAHEFEVEIPDNFDPITGVIATLKAEKQKVLADAHVKAKQIDDQIQSLLAIEYKPTETAA